MHTVLVLCVFLYAVGFGLAACPYNVKVLRAAPCKNNKNPIVSLVNNPGARFVGDDCRVQIDGCAHMNEEIKSVNVSKLSDNKNYDKLTIKAKKDGIPVLTLKKPGCGFVDGNFVVKCPLAKNSNLCAGKALFEVPGGSKVLGLVVGKIAATVDVITDKGTYCYDGEAILSKI